MNSQPRGGSFFKLLVVLIVVGSFALVVGSYRYYRRDERMVLQDKYQELKGIAQLKADQILRWRNERLSDARVHSSSPFIRSAASRWLRAPDQASLRDGILERMELVKEYEGYENIMMADREGNILVSLIPSLGHLDPSVKPLIAETVSVREAAIGDFYQCSVCGKIHIDVAAPILDEKNQPVAVSLLRVNPEIFLYPMIRAWPIPSRSGETLIVRRDGDEVLFLNDLRHRPRSALALRLPESQTSAPAVQAVKGNTGLVKGQDYRGVKVLAHIRAVPLSPWFMVSKVDTREALAEVRSRAFAIALIVLLLILLATAVASILFYRRQNIFFKRLQASEELFNKLFHISPIPSVLVRLRDLIFFDVNSSFERLFGYRKDEVVGRAITELDFQTGPEARAQAFQRLLQERKLQDLEFHYRNKAGREGVAIGYMEILDQRGEEYIIAEFVDITDRKRAEGERDETFLRLQTSLSAAIEAIAATVEKRDPYTAGHQRRVASLAQAMAREMGLPADRVEGVRMVGVIHDLGKISVPSEILTKPTELTTYEFNLIKIHPQTGYEILKDIQFPWPIARIILEHHERLNGSGYPRGLKSEELLLESKILAVADVVEAMASHRPYRPALGIEKALEEIEEQRGTLYDPQAVDTCLRLIREKGFIF